jgi:formyltetrahydrofolate deformylase
MEFTLDKSFSEATFREQFAAEVARPFLMDWHLHDTAQKPKLLILVSKFGHCLNDLLHRYHTGSLPVSIPAIISNHPDMEEVARWYQIPFHHLPIVNGDKHAQEQQILSFVQQKQIDLVVLARYMQVLSPDLCAALEGKAINIHHSFLPSFKGAKPYHQAYDRGVKIIGATAHYVTTDLDEGPIIEQEIARVDHTQTAEDLVAMGRDVECLVLSRAIKYHIEQRVLRNGSKTVIFR